MKMVKLQPGATVIPPAPLIKVYVYYYIFAIIPPSLICNHLRGLLQQLHMLYHIWRRMQLPFYFTGYYLDWLHHCWWAFQSLVRDTDGCEWISIIGCKWSIYHLGLLSFLLPH